MMLQRKKIVFLCLVFQFAALAVNAMMMEDKNFRTLECNADLGGAECKSWTETFGTASSHSGEISIPCGQCVSFDGEDPQVLTLGGLNVIGKLVIDKPVDMTTPYVIVQGELILNSNKKWDGTQDITITLTGTSSHTFMPADSNHHKCGGNPCSVGKKPFAIAGGKLTVNGMPGSDYDTPTWVHIQDVKVAENANAGSIAPVEAYPGLKDTEGCPSDGIFVSEDFSDGSERSATTYDVESSLGSHFTITEDALKVSNRKTHSQGPVFDMMGVMECIKPNVRYQVNARVKTYRESDGPDVEKESDCATDGSGCLDIRYNWHPKDKWNHREYVYHEEKSYGWQYGEEIYISETIVFNEDMLNSENIYTTFSFEGSKPGVVIELYDFEFKLASPEAYRSVGDVCTDLAPPNGDAELDPKSPFPYKTDAWYTNMVVVQDQDTNLGNHYFRIHGRGNSHHNSARWDAAVGCMTTNAVYNIKADYRLHPDERIPNPENHGFRVRLKVKRADNKDSWYYMAICEDSEVEVGVWNTCEKVFTVPDGVVREGDLQYEIVLETDRYINYDVDNISIIQSTGPINAVVVEDSVAGKWDVGAEVLITSHTSSWNDEQVRKIAQIEASEESGYVNIVLDDTIKAPTTMNDDPRFVTEIAILDRNIRVQGADDDPDPLHGGHLIVLHTPGDGQDIVGLEVTNMGQAGNLGRYPLHFHMCGDVTGSRLAKNLIRDTNQRCAVVHGTDHLLVDNNVAYDTFGHCFMVEDGMERFNTFSNNLGAKTKRATQVIPNMPAKNNGDETDGSAATFWITNPMNYFVDNVAAGGQNSGFWFELRHRPRGTMAKHYQGGEWALRSMSLGQFKGNIAHSYDGPGIRTYPNGYVPNNVAVMEDSRSYRNSNNGFFIHNSRNITVKGFILADNEQGIDLDRIDLFEMHDSEIIGRSEDYKDKVLTQKARNVCGGRPSFVRGVEMHTFRTDRNLLPTLQGKFKNVKFSGFNDTGCDQSAVFWADDEDRIPVWDYFTALEDSSSEGVSEGQIANFCRAVNKGIKDSYIVDQNSAFGSNPGNEPSTIMTYTDTIKQMQAFVEPTMCSDHPDHCYSYCENTCLRTMTVRVDPGISDQNTLKICKEDDPQSRCETYKSWYNHDTQDRFRLFSPALPAGKYSAEFLDDSGQVIWPRGVNITYEVDMCDGNGLSEGDVEFNVLKVDPAQCESLIVNGDAEASDTDPAPWVYERNMGIEVLTGQGIDGSNAFADVRTESHDDGLTQHLDTRCLAANKGREYQITAHVKLIDGNGQAVYCDPSIMHSWGCPRIILHWGIYRKEGEKWRRDREIEAGITRARNVNKDGYQLVSGTVVINEELATASNVRMFIERRSHNQEMLVDNVSMTLVSETTCAAGNELVRNGNFETGSSQYWYDYSADGFSIVSPGVGGSGYALRMKTGSALQWIKGECIEAGKRYMVSVKYRLLDSNGNASPCNAKTGNPRCPELVAQAYDEDKNYKGWLGTLAKSLDATADTDDGYSTLWGVWEPTMDHASMAFVRIYFYYTGHYTIIDDVSIKELGSGGLTTLEDSDGEESRAATQQELIVNGNNQLGLATFWSGSGVRDSNIVTTAGHGDSVAARLTGRSRWYHGMWYSGERYMDKGALIASSKWKISAYVKLLEPGSENGVVCDRLNKHNYKTRCPRVRVRLYDVADPYTPVREETIYSYPNEWDTNGWNLFDGRFEVPSSRDYTINKIVILFGEAIEKKDIVVDDLSVVPAV